MKYENYKMNSKSHTYAICTHVFYEILHEWVTMACTHTLECTKLYQCVCVCAIRCDDTRKRRKRNEFNEHICTDIYTKKIERETNENTSKQWPNV